jgi:hypothetical protein
MLQDSETIHSIVIGLGFRARSGKDSAAAAIIGTHSNQYSIKRFAFADELKREVNEMAQQAGGMQNLFLKHKGIWPSWVGYEKDAPIDYLCPEGKQRRLLQYWGVYRREQDENYWVEKVAKKISEDQPMVALVSDLRFKNEKKWIEQYGDSIRVDRPGLDSLDSHISEQELAKVPDYEWGAILKNDCSLEEFQTRAVNVFDYLMERPQGVKNA